MKSILAFLLALISSMSLAQHHAPGKRTFYFYDATGFILVDGNKTKSEYRLFVEYPDLPGKGLQETYIDKDGKVEQVFDQPPQEAKFIFLHGRDTMQVHLSRIECSSFTLDAIIFTKGRFSLEVHDPYSGEEGCYWKVTRWDEPNPLYRSRWELSSPERYLITDGYNFTVRFEHWDFGSTLYIGDHCGFGYSLEGNILKLKVSICTTSHGGSGFFPCCEETEIPWAMKDGHLILKINGEDLIFKRLVK